MIIKKIVGKIKYIFKRLFLQRTMYRFVLKSWKPIFDLSASNQVLETKRFSQHLTPQLLPHPEANRVVVIAPHPDDDIFGAGGTILNAIYSDIEVHSCYITDVGDNPEQNAAIHREITAACAEIGLQPHFLGMKSNHISFDDTGRIAELIDILNDIKPDCIMITFLLDDHDDHRRVNELLLKISSRVVHPPKEIWAYQIYSTVIPNVVVDITTQVKKKEKAMRLLQSVKGNRDWAHYVLGINAMNCRFIPTRDPVYGETFFVVPWNEYLNLCKQYFSNGAENVYYNPNYRMNKTTLKVVKYND